MTKNKLVTLGLFSVIFLLIISALVYNQFKSNELRQNGIILNARIIGIGLVTKGSPTFNYMFNYNGEEFSNESSTGVRKKNVFIGRTFPIIFSPKTKDSELLISPKDFEKFGILFPDSLRWVLRYENN